MPPPLPALPPSLPLSSVLPLSPPPGAGVPWLSGAGACWVVGGVTIRDGCAQHWKSYPSTPDAAGHNDHLAKSFMCPTKHLDRVTHQYFQVRSATSCHTTPACLLCWQPFGGRPVYSRSLSRDARDRRLTRTSPEKNENFRSSMHHTQALTCCVHLVIGSPKIAWENYLGATTKGPNHPFPVF